MPARPGSVMTMPAAAFATSVAEETAIPICACRRAGASLAPSPHMPTTWPWTLQHLHQAVLLLRHDAGEHAELVGARIVGDAFRRTERAGDADLAGDGRRRHCRIPGHHDGADLHVAQRAMSPAESSRGGSLSAIRPARRSASVRPDRDRDDPVSLLRKPVDPAPRVRGHLRHACNDLERALDDAKLAPVAIDGEGLGRLGRRIERNEAHQSFGRAAHPLAFGSRSNGGVDRVLVRLGARQRGKRQHAIAIERPAWRRRRRLPAYCASGCRSCRRTDTSMAAASCAAERRVSKTPRRARSGRRMRPTA